MIISNTLSHSQKPLCSDHELHSQPIRKECQAEEALTRDSTRLVPLNSKRARLVSHTTERVTWASRQSLSKNPASVSWNPAHFLCADSRH